MRPELADLASFAPGDQFPFDLAQGLRHGYAALREFETYERPISERFPRSWYSPQPVLGDPVLDAPLTEPSGGCVYAGAPLDGATLDAVLTVLGQAPTTTRYAVSVRLATDIAAQRFATEVRVLHEGWAREAGLRLPERLVSQPLALREFLWRFTAVAADDDRLYGAYGEDGDDAYAKPAFGFWVENADFRILRCWSRPWLVTK